MVECLVYIGEPLPSSAPLRLNFAAVPRQGDLVFFKTRHAMQAEAYDVQRIAFLAQDAKIAPEIQLVVKPQVLSVFSRGES